MRRAKWSAAASQDRGVWKSSVANQQNGKFGKTGSIGSQSVSWTNDVLADLGGDIPLEVCLSEASEIGYEGTELGRKYPKDPKVLAPKLSEYGFRLAAGWYSGLLAVRSVEEEWAAAAKSCSVVERVWFPGARLWGGRENAIPRSAAEPKS